jgi:hypothetical protein
LLEAAFLPMMTDLVADGAAKIRAAAGPAGREGEAAKTLSAAVAFTSLARARIESRNGSDELAAARAVQGQLELCFLKTAGVDVADPASVSAAQFSSWMAGGKSLLKAAADLTIAPQWLTRPLRSKATIAMPPYTPSAEVAVKAGKAGAR